MATISVIPEKHAIHRYAANVLRAHPDVDVDTLTAWAYMYFTGLVPRDIDIPDIYYEAVEEAFAEHVQRNTPKRVVWNAENHL